tara:strand:- start:868 stop:1098 length:231 start_codon:yes stop_codon:yes gene_type:complete
MKQNVELIVFGVLCDEEWHSTAELCEAVVTPGWHATHYCEVAAYGDVRAALEDLREHFSIRSRYKDGRVSWKIGGK